MDHTNLTLGCKLIEDACRNEYNRCNELGNVWFWYEWDRIVAVHMIMWTSMNIEENNEMLAWNETKKNITFVTFIFVKK